MKLNSNTIAIIGLILSIITLYLMYQRSKTEAAAAEEQKKLWALQAELHKEQLKDIKAYNGQREI